MYFSDHLTFPALVYIDLLDVMLCSPRRKPNKYFVPRKFILSLEKKLSNLPFKYIVAGRDIIHYTPYPYHKNKILIFFSSSSCVMGHQNVWCCFLKFNVSHLILYNFLINLLIAVIINLPCILSRSYSYSHTEYSIYVLGFLELNPSNPDFIKGENITNTGIFLVSISRGNIPTSNWNYSSLSLFC